MKIIISRNLKSKNKGLRCFICLEPINAGVELTECPNYHTYVYTYPGEKGVLFNYVYTTSIWWGRPWKDFITNWFIETYYALDEGSNYVFKYTNLS
jgi:hypothetical protein